MRRSEAILQTVALTAASLLWQTTTTIEAFQSNSLLFSRIKPSQNVNSPQQYKSSLLYRAEGDESSDDDEFNDAVFAEWDEDERTASKMDDQPAPWKKNARWESLNPRVKLKVIEEAHQRAIRNKQKREPLQDKKRRMMEFYKKTQNRKRRDSRVKRPLPFTARTPLSNLTINSNINGTIISLTDFGVYVDVGTECDGLLHISQITRDEFIVHPRQCFSPGDEVDVRVKNFNPDMKKLWLTMLPIEEEEEEENEDNDGEDRILLEDVAVDDELWGEIVRVTDYGAYIDMGVEVTGFLHFMDHPDFGIVKGAHPREFMSVGQRVRVWASDVDGERRRIKLTANRPESLPVLKRELRY
eukprot:CAMPEP_0172490846 /NCGR_PEP_ID=MMETSP1066-20121228/21424_1 /TAXON_ID=671091 /ORGANISM="Coscinodiscus wailesii, Strain CCMP2513" /LENGTH=355 /DNA_ID=CAMNT_0013259529 /DNA_START=102 /DNA_END=1169 /DNA_ORIENTATION=+